MKELEYKFLLSKEDFQKHLQKANDLNLKTNSTLQINYYYDNENLDLLKENITVRIRQKEDKLKLEIKEHKITNSEFSESAEKETEIQKLTQTLSILQYENLKLKGNLVTNRQTLFVNDGIHLDFDTNYYLGTCDYEIELEFEEKHSEKVKEIISLFNFNFQNKPKNKAERFFEALERLNTNGKV
ncbi:MAG: CYTH domain-containing protein [Bacillota bacterium]|nr:CYTH domain-containing protein [Bacillota bacterium]